MTNLLQSRNTKGGRYSPLTQSGLGLASKSGITQMLLVLAGILSLLLAEQIVSGWLPLGARANISRRELNPLEWVAIVASVAWGLLNLWTLFALSQQTRAASVRDYFQQGNLSDSPGVLYVIAALVVFGIVGLLLAEQILAGWLALGETVNISRRDLNLVEWAVLIGSAFWGVLSLRTAWDLYRRKKSAWSWALWVLLLTAVLGLILFVDGLMNIRNALPPGGMLLDNLAGVQEVMMPAVLLMLSALAAYRLATLDAPLTADQVIRNKLAKTPGAGAIVGFITIFVVFSLARPDLFLEPRALAGSLTTNVSLGIVAIGISMLMISGEFDLSVGSQFGVSGLAFLSLMTRGIFGEPVPIVMAIILTLFISALLGLINGFLLIRTGIPSFIVTLGTLLAFRAIPLVLAEGGGILRYADFYGSQPPMLYVNRYLIIAVAALALILLAFIGRSLLTGGWRSMVERWRNYDSEKDDFRSVKLVASIARVAINVVILLLLAWLFVSLLVDQVNLLPNGVLQEINAFDVLNGRIESLPRDVNLRTSVFWWLLLVLIFEFILTQTRYGNSTFAAGGNPGAARAQGINVSRVKVLNFVLCSLLVGIASILDVARVESVDALRGADLELQAIAASVIGGTLLTGGYGSIFGVLLGVFIFGMLPTGLVLMNVNARLFNGVIGIIIIVAVVINTAARRIKT
jgi:D-xylose transport system permease protein